MLETELAPYFTTKAPFQFPTDFRAGFVKYWPIIKLILLLLALPGLLAFLGIGAIFLPASFMGGAGVGFGYTISMVLGLVGLVLSILSLPGLFNRQRAGWVFSYYAELVSLLAGLISLNIVGILLGLLFLMLLFQVRDYYN